MPVGAQPAAVNQQALHSSLAEVLIHHGVPAVLGMRTRLLIEKPLASFEPLPKLCDRGCRLIKPDRQATAIDAL